MNEAQEIMLTGIVCGAGLAACCFALALIARRLIDGIRARRAPQRLTRTIRPGVV